MTTQTKMPCPPLDLDLVCRLADTFKDHLKELSPGLKKQDPSNTEKAQAIILGIHATAAFGVLYRDMLTLAQDMHEAPKQIEKAIQQVLSPVEG